MGDGERPHNFSPHSTPAATFARGLRASTGQASTRPLTNQTATALLWSTATDTSTPANQSLILVMMFGLVGRWVKAKMVAASTMC